MAGQIWIIGLVGNISVKGISNGSGEHTRLLFSNVDKSQDVRI